MDADGFDPSRDRGIFGNGVRWCRIARPPANGFQATGLDEWAVGHVGGFSLAGLDWAGAVSDAWVG